MIKSLHFLIIFLILIITSSFAQNKSKIPEDFCMTQDEYRLFSLINEYRTKLALNTIPLSKSLSYVAKTHAKDLAGNFNPASDCNMHSWSDKGNWKPFCFPKDQNRKHDVKDKAKELSNYPGKAWELTYWENSKADLDFVLDFWMSIPYTADMISSSNAWEKKEWKSMGVGIQDGYVLVWMGTDVDVEISTLICETGERIMNKSIPNELNAPVVQNNTKANEGTYFIIIGSFKVKSDASSAVESYHQMGYPNAVVIESQGRIRVAIDAFISQELADASLEKYRNKFQGAWIFLKK